MNEALAEQLEGRGDILLCPLHGELSWPSSVAIEPAPASLRKVVLATNIAETSLTIEGVRVVVDAGLARVPRFDPGSGMTRLETPAHLPRLGHATGGRAGRLEPGACYRLWSEEQHGQLAAYGEAEILRADLAGVALQLARWGVELDELARSIVRRPPPTVRRRPCWSARCAAAQRARRLAADPSRPCDGRAAGASAPAHTAAARQALVAALAADGGAAGRA